MGVEAAPTTPMSTENFAIPLEDAPVDSVRAILQSPTCATDAPAVLLAHGSGAPMESEFMEATASALVAEGLSVMRFRYAYTERAAQEGKRRPPDRMPLLENVHRAALQALRERIPDRPVVLGGKSMGGRVASHLAAQGVPCAGLAFLGYPLHPAGKPESLRSEHFPRITAPSLFLQGTRDKLCDLALLERELGSYGAPHVVHVVEGGDHSFDVLKRSGRNEAEVRAEVVQAFVAWARGL